MAIQSPVTICGEDSSGNSESIKINYGAIPSYDTGRAVQPHNRFITIAGNVVATDIATATWTESEGVYSCRFRVDAVTAGNRIRVVFDASPVDDSSDTTQAESWLTAAITSETLDVEYFEITGAALVAAEVGPVGVSEWSEWFQFSSPLRRVDAIAVDVDEAVNVLIEVA